MHFSNVGAIPLGHPAVRAIDSDLKQERMSGIVVGWKHCQGKVKTKRPPDDFRSVSTVLDNVLPSTSRYVS
ncbi:hypothetical protein R3P38DRAFT_3193234 [Favolaschia claudopus]|uniref:Uncharacterized protein n=1 Tax=Favolaschia claudopus TaxID=2862362 RepID=A0AAW0BII8_9AGAR